MREIHLRREDCEALFDQDSESITELIISVFKVIFPNWDQIETVTDYVQCSEKCWHYFCNRFMTKFKSVPNAGLMWMNWGFSVGNESDRIVDVDEDYWTLRVPEVVLKGNVNEDVSCNV